MYIMAVKHSGFIFLSRQLLCYCCSCPSTESGFPANLQIIVQIISSHSRQIELAQNIITQVEATGTICFLLFLFLLTAWPAVISLYSIIIIIIFLFCGSKLFLSNCSLKTVAFQIHCYIFVSVLLLCQKRSNKSPLAFPVVFWPSFCTRCPSWCNLPDRV